MAFFDDPERSAAQNIKTNEPEHKIGYVADRLEAQSNETQANVKEDKTSYIITDWASF